MLDHRIRIRNIELLIAELTQIPGVSQKRGDVIVGCFKLSLANVQQGNLDVRLIREIKDLPHARRATYVQDRHRPRQTLKPGSKPLVSSCTQAGCEQWGSR